MTFVSSVFNAAQPDAAVTEPKLLSLYPLGGRRGTTVQAEVRGNLLERAYAVWFDAGSLSGRVVKVEEVKEQSKEKVNVLEKKPEKPPTVYRALIEVEIQPTAHLGIHSLRLVGPRGISDAVPFRVVDEPVVLETATPHQTAARAQPVGIPAIISGKLGEPGELDFYLFQAKKGQELSLEVISVQNSDLRLALYRPGGSWFDPDRPSRLLLSEERSSDIMRPHRNGTYQVLQDGEYLLEASSLYSKGSPDSSYQVRITSLAQAQQYAAQSKTPSGEWGERSFGRRLDDKWLTNLEARQFKPGTETGTPPKDASSAQESTVNSSMDQKQRPLVNLPVRLSFASEREPNDRADQAEDLSVPSVVEGTIEHPGDIDSFKFKVEAGQKLAFEIETPDAQPPYFNPRLGVVDSQSRELFSSIERVLSILNNNSAPEVYLKEMEPKATYTFERAANTYSRSATSHRGTEARAIVTEF